jgi:hypothetical protein
MLQSVLFETLWLQILEWDKKMVAESEKVKFSEDCSEIREWAFSASTLTCDWDDKSVVRIAVTRPNWKRLPPRDEIQASAQKSCDFIEVRELLRYLAKLYNNNNNNFYRVFFSNYALIFQTNISMSDNKGIMTALSILLFLSVSLAEKT